MMSWVCKFQNDADKEDVGLLTAIYSENDIEVFRFSGRIDSKTDIAAFVQKAKEAKTKFDTDQPRNAVIEQTVETELNK